ncbi:hypothetical protein KIPB_009594 [Kipferlia bialata]|uniref:Uncharacterized protein n=1 Tax=Kipferlia bialata TaxID=797122 RepID=A0A9K3GKW0_9EUKA|nr:hypothetical protein KIPB_009594 [Kipferlia bialata]|eukprot:g9594.t1
MCRPFTLTGSPTAYYTSPVPSIRMQETHDAEEAEFTMFSAPDFTNFPISPSHPAPLEPESAQEEEMTSVFTAPEPPVAEEPQEPEPVPVEVSELQAALSMKDEERGEFTPQPPISIPVHPVPGASLSHLMTGSNRLSSPSIRQAEMEREQVERDKEREDWLFALKPEHTTRSVANSLDTATGPVAEDDVSESDSCPPQQEVHAVPAPEPKVEMEERERETVEETEEREREVTYVPAALPLPQEPKVEMPLPIERVAAAPLDREGERERERERVNPALPVVEGYLYVLELDTRL